MSIALTGKVEDLAHRLEVAEARIAELAAEAIRLAYRLGEAEQALAARKPGTKSKDSSCQ